MISWIKIVEMARKFADVNVAVIPTSARDAELELEDMTSQEDRSRSVCVKSRTEEKVKVGRREHDGLV